MCDKARFDMKEKINWLFAIKLCTKLQAIAKSSLEHFEAPIVWKRK